MEITVKVVLVVYNSDFDGSNMGLISLFIVSKHGNYTHFL